MERFRSGGAAPHVLPPNRMAQARKVPGRWVYAAGLLVGCAGGFARAAEVSPDVLEQLREVRRQNEALQQQVRQQREMIEELNRKVTTLLTTVESSPSPLTDSPATDPAPASKGFSLGRLRLSGEGAAGVFHSQGNGQYPNTEFRVDEAKLFAEAPIWGEAYFFGELNLFTRETLFNSDLFAGEVYLDVENISRLWDRDRQLNLRVGRFDIPIGEEYLTRDAIDNPLISHSIMDLWGVDEGVELYGSVQRWQYVAAVQNGGRSAVRDFHQDKSVAVRLGYDPVPKLHLSVSAMRTGALDVRNDRNSELWLGPGLVRSLGSAATTTFETDVLEGNVHLQLPRTTIKAAGGVLRYDDNDPAANNRRQVHYYSLEVVHNLYRGAYAAARWSQVFAPDGFPIVANGDRGAYFNDVLTEDLWLLSLGLGYRWSYQLHFKAEYSFARGHVLGGTPREKEDLVAAVVAFAF